MGLQNHRCRDDENYRCCTVLLLLADGLLPAVVFILKAGRCNDGVILLINFLNIVVTVPIAYMVVVDCYWGEMYSGQVDLLHAPSL